VADLERMPRDIDPMDTLAWDRMTPDRMPETRRHAQRIGPTASRAAPCSFLPSHGHDPFPPRAPHANHTEPEPFHTEAYE
jgi:hypothetical protein